MESKKLKNFKELKIWQKGMEIVKDVYKISKNFPPDELYGLSVQMRRSAISIPSNIAEGFKRFHVKENQQFLRIALGSIAELETQMIISNQLGYITNNILNLICEKIDHEGRMITLYHKKISERRS